MKELSKSCHLISAKQFAQWFHCGLNDLSRDCISCLKSLDRRIRPPSPEERDSYFIGFIDLIRSGRIVRNEDQNRIAWERGWRQNLNDLKSGLPVEQSVKPGYFRGSRFLRLDNDLVVSQNPHVEHDLFTAARFHLFHHYLQPYSNIVEIGCGSGQNLWMLAKLFPDKHIYGLDWVNSSIALANALGRRCGGRITGNKFNMLHPDTSFQLPPHCAVFTIHAMEQLGRQHGALLAYLMAQAPQIVLHYEPIVEFYDPHQFLDYLALWYCRRRRYLHGYWPLLQKIVSKKSIRIITAFRPYLGGELHESSVIVWQPLSRLAKSKRNMP